MYAKNAASPERIAIGPVILIADGTVQTAGVTVRVLPFGGSEADGLGTTAYSTDGVVLYTPTQAETNYTSFVLIAKKSACIPASVTVVTSESTISGRVFVGTNSDKTGYTATVADKTGFKLASDGLALVTAWTVGITGNLTGDVTGSVGSINGVSYPVNFGVLGIGATGEILLVQEVEELGANALTANGAGDVIPDYVWGELLADQTTVDTFGAMLVRSANSNNTVQITGGGSNHIFAVLHDAEPDSIPENAFQNDAISARVIADNAIDAASISANALNGKGDWLTSLGANAPAGWINAASITTDAITNDKIAASAVTKITVGLFRYGDVQRWNSPQNQIDVTITKV